MQIVFALLAHQNPGIVARLISALVDAGHFVAVHYDRNSPAAEYATLASAFEGNTSVLMSRRFRVSWGQWSIVQASLQCLQLIEDAAWEPDYVYLISGSDYPIRSSADLESFLERNRGMEFIECVPAERLHWVRGGPQQERYEHRFYFNWRSHPNLFELSLNLQKRLGLTRRFVRNMEPNLGSQWWALTWKTLKQILAISRERDIRRFFRTTLIPDELFFQTLVSHLVPEQRIVGRTLTHYHFTDYGVPVVYYADHLDYLLRQPFFMARKISPYNPQFFDRLDACWRGELSSAPFRDAIFGATTPEYERHRLTYRDGSPGLPVAGKVLDFGGLRRPFFVALGCSSMELQLVRRALSLRPNIVCHGHLFRSDAIEFANGAENYAGYAAKDIESRDRSALKFIADIVNAEPFRMTGFLMRWGEHQTIQDSLLFSPSARVAVFTGDPLLAFLETLQPGILQLENVNEIFLKTIPRDTLLSHLDQFMDAYRSELVSIRKLSERPRPRANIKRGIRRPEQRLMQIDLSTYSSMLWSRFSMAIELWLNLEFDRLTQNSAWNVLTGDFERLERFRAHAATYLESIGVRPSQFEDLRVTQTPVDRQTIDQLRLLPSGE